MLAESVGNTSIPVATRGLVVRVLRSVSGICRSESLHLPDPSPLSDTPHLFQQRGQHKRDVAPPCTHPTAQCWGHLVTACHTTVICVVFVDDCLIFCTVKGVCFLLTYTQTIASRLTCHCCVCTTASNASFSSFGNSFPLVSALRKMPAHAFLLK